MFPIYILLIFEPSLFVENNLVDDQKEHLHIVDIHCCCNPYVYIDSVGHQSVFVHVASMRNAALLLTFVHIFIVHQFSKKNQTQEQINLYLPTLE